MGERFDEAYYARHYGDPETRVADAESIYPLVGFVCAYLRFLHLEPLTALDLGCGEGLWQAPLKEQFPELEYRGVEVSQTMCRKHGWTQASVTGYSGKPADLVICQGVLQYLDTKEAAAAIENLAKLTRGALYLEALTQRDWEQDCDQSITDGDVHLRSGAWYRKRLKKHFIFAGGGLFVHREAGAVFFELEAE